MGCQGFKGEGSSSNLWFAILHGQNLLYITYDCKEITEFNCLIKYEASRIQAIKWDVKSRVDCCRRFKHFAEQNPLQSLGYLLLSVNRWKEELLFRSLGSWLDHGKFFCLLFEFLCCSLSSWFSLIFAEFRRRLLSLIRFAHYYYYNNNIQGPCSSIESVLWYRNHF